MMIIKKLVFFTCVVLMSCRLTYSATYYVSPQGNDSTGNGSSGNRWATITKGIASMSGGDTLIIGVGTYSQPVVNMPSGSNGSYTNIIAESDFGVNVTANNALYISGKSYVRVCGINFNGNNYSDTGVVSSSNHVKIIRCTFNGALASETNYNIMELAITSQSNFVTVEECAAWGTGRYKFLVYKSSNCVIRRCLARHDFAPATQCALFHRYDSYNVDFQNCIGLDSGLASGENGNLYAGIYNDNHDPFVDNSGANLGCILLNLGAGIPIHDIRIWGTRIIENCVVASCIRGIDESNYRDGSTWLSPSNCLINHCTLANINDPNSGWSGGYAFFNESGKTNLSTSSNTIIMNSTLALQNISGEDYNCLYGNTSNRSNTPTGIHSNTNNPQLKYLVQASSNAGNASDSGYIGATILYEIGSPESFYGDTDYNTITNVPLWPFPNESVFKALMSVYSGSYNWSGGNGSISGARGFCTGTSLDGTPQTLTKYIWEYLGNQMPGNAMFPVETPTGLTGVAKSQNSIALIWLDHATNETGFRIERKMALGGLYEQVATVGANVTAHTDTGLVADTTYYYRVRAYNATSNSGYSNEIAVVTDVTAGTDPGSVDPGTTGTGAGGGVTADDITAFATLEIGQILVVGSTQSAGAVNPDKGETVKIYYKGADRGTYECRIFNLSGMMVWQTSRESTPTGVFEWLPTDMAPGGYVASVKGPGLNDKKKIAVVR